MIRKDWRAVPGNTFPVKEELKELGGVWDRDTGLWWVPPDKFREAEEVVENARSRKGRRG